MCEHCNRSDHDSNSCTYYISADGFARLSSMIEIMNEQQLKLTNFIREHDLSHQIDPRLRSPEPNGNLCDDGESFPTIESELEKVFDLPSTTLPYVGLSSPNTLTDNTSSLMIFLIHLTL